MEQNNIEQNQIQPPVEGVKKQNNNIGLIVILVLIIIALVGYIIYTKLSENTETPVVNNNVSTKNDDIKNESNTDNKIYDDITYKLEETDVITYKYSYRAGEGTEKYEPPFVEKVKYPVFSGGDDSISELNNKIKNSVNTFIENFKNSGVEQKKYDGSEGYISEDSNGKKLFYRSVDMFYHIAETEEYIQIFEDISDDTDGTGIYKNKNIYTIDKKGKKYLKNNEFINNIENIEEIKDSLITYIKEKDEIYLRDGISDKNKYISIIEDRLDNNNFMFEFENFEDIENYVFWFEFEDFYKYDVYVYSIETKSWE